MKGADFAIAIEEISAVGRLPGDAFDRSPFIPLLAITLKSGEGLFVQLANVDDWVAELEGTISN